ncbi:hypothetical protein ALT761_00818 [Alteromonas sp. 76-1]|nr:hypothetical protein ALT761_00818 [Alteromonas sp. 76-1]
MSTGLMNSCLLNRPIELAESNNTLVIHIGLIRLKTFSLTSKAVT